jgi:hypothetical protein
MELVPSSSILDSMERLYMIPILDRTQNIKEPTRIYMSAAILTPFFALIVGIYLKFKRETLVLDEQNLDSLSYYLNPWINYLIGPVDHYYFLQYTIAGIFFSKITFLLCITEVNKMRRASEENLRRRGFTVVIIGFGLSAFFLFGAFLYIYRQTHHLQEFSVDRATSTTIGRISESVLLPCIPSMLSICALFFTMSAVLFVRYVRVLGEK